MPKLSLPVRRKRARAPKAEAPRPSRHVRKLSPRQPLPKRKGDLLIFITEQVRRFPIVFAATAAFVFIVITFHQYLMKSDYFSVSRIDVAGTHRLSEEQVLRTLGTRAGLKVGDSIFNATERAMSNAVQAIPEVETASVRKEWPSTVSIVLEEKKAVGIYATPTASYVYDGRGIVFARATSADFRALTRPLITASPKADVQPGFQISPVELARADQYLEIFTKAAPSLAKTISEFHFAPETGITVVLAGGERFDCGARPPQETGPAIESLMTVATLDAPVVTANLVSSTHAIIRRADPLLSIDGKQIARNE
ncbi:FtsQ-type POTRA domain-containing protein [Candidatus Sumerlaeota bacterium]|nr:FtsQ-type POTRA domain-containing protein [Candidatus Sumerlaeota bacterium]